MHERTSISAMYNTHAQQRVAALHMQPGHHAETRHPGTMQRTGTRERACRSGTGRNPLVNAHHAPQPRSIAWGGGGEMKGGAPCVLREVSGIPTRWFRNFRGETAATRAAAPARTAPTATRRADAPSPPAHANHASRENTNSANTRKRQTTHPRTRTTVNRGDCFRSEQTLQYMHMYDTKL